MTEYCVTFGYCDDGDMESSYTERDIVAANIDELYEKLDTITNEANKEPGFSMWVSKVEEY